MNSAKLEPMGLRKLVQALDCADSVWYRYTLRKDVCGCKLSVDEEAAVMEGAVRIADDMARQVAKQYGALSPQELAAAMDIKLAHECEELREPCQYLYISLYEPYTRTITLNDSAISCLQKFIDRNMLASLTPPDDIIRTALYHEIFHALEEETPSIYTRSRMLNRRLLGLFPYKRGLDAVSEVGAVHFSKRMAGITYSPCIFERYILMALGRLSIDFLTPNV